MKRFFVVVTLLSLSHLAACAGLESGTDNDFGWGGQGPGTGGADTGYASGGSSFGTGGHSVATGGTVATGGGPGNSCVFPVWSATNAYPVGSIVQYPGTSDFYVAVNATDVGIDPTISTWYWQPHGCVSSGSGGNTGAGGSSNTAFSNLLSEAVFNQMFPAKDRDPIYSYAGLLEAVADYPAFAATGDTDTRKREIAAFLANVAQETGFLRYTREIARGEYCEPRGDCPCQGGQQYYGRGAIQLSWNYNYCAASSALSSLGYDLRANPDLVASVPELAWVTGIWYWMERDGGSGSTPHAAITGGQGFGATIRAINGSLECGGNWSSRAGPLRVANYESFCALLGVSPGGALTC